MGAQLSQLLTNKITRVQRVFETEEGEYNLDLSITHKRITTEVQLALQAIADTEYKNLSKSLEIPTKVRAGELPPESLRDFDLYKARSVTCLQLEYLVIDLDIVDEKKKAIKPTYDNLIKFPLDLLNAIKEDIDNSILPKKSNSTTLANGTRQAVPEALPQIG